MGFRDTEYPNPLELFPATSEPMNMNNERLRQRLRAGQGLPLYRADQLDAVYDDLDDEPLIRLEYDRFLPEINKPFH